MKKKMIAAFAAGISLLSASAAHAASLNTAATVTGSANSAVDTAITGTASTGVQAGTSANAGTNANVNTNTDTNVNGGMQGDQGANASTDAHMNAGDDTSMSADAMSAADTSDPNFSVSTATTDGMDLTYIQPTKYFGFIPGHIRTKVHVDGNGQVTVSYPWYSFLATTADTTALKTELQSKIQTAFDQSATTTTNANVNANAHAQMMAHSLGELGAQTRVRLIHAIHSVLSGSASASTTSSANASI